jgi:hypothetical protein
VKAVTDAARLRCFRCTGDVGQSTLERYLPAARRRATECRCVRACERVPLRAHEGRIRINDGCVQSAKKAVLTSTNRDRRREGSGRRGSNSHNQLGRQNSAEFGELQRTSADDSPSADPLGEQGQAPADLGGCAINVPWPEDRVELPPTVLQSLERQASEHEVSVGTLICAIVVRSPTGLADGPGAEK